MASTTSPPSPSPRENFQPLVLPGVLLWFVIALLAIALRGVRWDEDYEFGQVIAGAITYPDGHPLPRYLSHTFSLQPYSAALLIKLGAGPNLVNGLRNFLYLLATVLPPFLFVTWFTRRPALGHAATLLVLQGTLRHFDSTYPLKLWPSLYSNGHIGEGWTLLTLFCLLSGHLRMGTLMLGLMPLVHVGQFPLLALFAAVHLAMKYPRNSEDSPALPLKSLLLWTSAGFAACLVFLVYQATFHWLPAPTEGPYASNADPWPLWTYYTAHHDDHRGFPSLSGHIILAAALLLHGLAAFHHDAPLRTYARGALLFCVLCAGIVWGILTVHHLLAPNVPFLLISWMPYRLINFAPTLTLVLSVVLLARAGGSVGNALIIAAVGFNALRWTLEGLAPATLYTRYVSMDDLSTYVLYGAALATALRSLPGTHRKPLALALCLVASVLLALYHQFGAACLLMGSLIILYAPLLPAKASFPWAAYATTAIALAFLLHAQYTLRGHLPHTEFDRAVTVYLHEHGEDAAPLVAGPRPVALQARTGHPVLTDAALPSWISYTPSLAPSIETLYNDLYGMSFEKPHESFDGRPWAEHWKTRSPETWQALGKKYGFGYLIAPNEIPLPFPTLLTQDNQTLYKIE